VREYLNQLRERYVRAPIVARLRYEVASILLTQPLIYNEPDRVHISPTATVNNALFNTASGCITVKSDAFFGHNVCLLTGTHDYTKVRTARHRAIPASGRDILVEEGAWLASNVTVLGPCVIGADAVVASGSLVRSNVPPRAIFAGVPARQVGTIDDWKGEP
jgi:acetyltransferase-like isoleucine patch superfamily enzyme